MRGLAVKRSSVVAMSVLAAIVFGGTYFASPYYAAQVIQDAARNHDLIALNEHVDYPAVRDSLKDQFQTLLSDQIRRSGDSDTTLALLGSAAAAMFMDRIIDTLIRPESVAALLKNGSLLAPQVESRSSPKAKRNRSSSAPAASPGSGAIDAHDASPEAVLAYHGLDRFEMSVQPRSHAVGPARFVLARHGVFHWELIAILVPMEDLAKR